MNQNYKVVITVIVEKSSKGQKKYENRKQCLLKKPTWTSALNKRHFEIISPF